MTQATTTPTPTEDRCAHCKQWRPLFRYQPAHEGGHLHPGLVVGCRWCTRDVQPMLCARCWSDEREREENDPLLDEEAETWEQILRTNARLDARRWADREAVAGIAAASGMTSGA